MWLTTSHDGIRIDEEQESSEIASRVMIWWLMEDYDKTLFMVFYEKWLFKIKIHWPDFKIRKMPDDIGNIKCWFLTIRKGLRCLDNIWNKLLFTQAFAMIDWNLTTVGSRIFNLKKYSFSAPDISPCFQTFY